MRECSGHAQAIADLAASPAGTRLASASIDGTVKLWSWDTGACLRTLEPGLGPLHCLAWSADNRLLAVSGERGVALCDIQGQSPPRILQTHSLRVSSVAVHGDRLACGGPNGTVVIADLRTGRKLHTLESHKRVVSALAFSADGKLLATGAADDRIRFWDATQDFAPLAAGNVSAAQWDRIAFDRKGRYVAASAAGTMYLWDVHSLPPIPIAHAGAQAWCFSADGTALLLGWHLGSVDRYGLQEIEKNRSQPKGIDATTFGPMPASTTLVPGGHIGLVWGVAASPDCQWIATAGHDGTVKLWDARTRKLIRSLDGHRDVVWCVAFSPDSKYLATGSDASGCVKIWEVATGREQRQFLGHERMVTGVAFHPGGRFLASSSLDGSVYLWDLAGGKSPGLLHKFDRSVYGVAFHPDGRWLAAPCLDNRVALWDLAEMPTAAVAPSRFLEGHTSGVYSVGFSADGRYLATGAEGGNMVLWDARTFSRITTFHAGTGQLRGIAFSRDGRLLAAAAYVGPTVVWDLNLVRRSLAEMNLDW